MTSLVLNAFRELRTPKLDRIWLASLAVILLIAIFKPDYFSDRVWFGLTALAHTMPYVLFACLIIGALAAAGAQSVLAKAFEGREIRMIFCATLLGALMPFCSCEVIPFIAAMLVAGAPLSAVMAFWLASPIIDPPTLIIAAAVPGWPFAIGKMVAAIGIGALVGAAAYLNGYAAAPLVAGLME